MTKKLSIKNLAILLPFFIVLFLILFIQSPFYTDVSKEFSIAIILDFIITAPIIYFFLIRKNEKIPNYTAISFFVINILIASFIIPLENQYFLPFLTNVLVPVLEIGILSFIIYKTWNVIQQFKSQNKEGLDFYEALQTACSEVFPNKVGQILAMEIAVVYYVFFNHKKYIPKDNEYTYFIKSGIFSMIWVLIFVLLIETVAIHLLVERWSIVAAWILTFLSIYTCLQIIALMRSMKSRLIKIDKENQILHLKYGFFNQVDISIKDIEEIEISRKSFNKESGIVHLSALDVLDSHNVILHLKNEYVLNRIYGLKKKFKKIALFIDEKESFQKELLNIIK